MKEKSEKVSRSAREKLRRGWRLFLAAVIAAPVCFLLSCGRLESGQHMEPGYTKEVSGQWELTDSRVVGPSPAEGNALVRAWMEEDRLVYDIGGEGARARLTLYTESPGDLFYANDHVEMVFRMEREADAEETPGDILCLFYLAGGVTEDESGVSLTDSRRFKYAYSGEQDMEPITYVSALTRTYESEPARKSPHFAVANAFFPEGQRDGEELYIVMDAEDDRGAGVHTDLVWQYRWTQGPLTVEVPPQPGVIEYYRAYSIWDIVLRAVAWVLTAAAAVLLVRQLVLAVKAKKEKSAGAR